MSILGLTHDEHGHAVQRLPVSIKVAIGEGPDPSDPSGFPRKVDHFLFKRKTLKGKDVVWESDTEVTERYGTSCREVGIVFMDDDIENVFRTSLTWWKATERQCWGELIQIEGSGYAMQATRRTDKHPEGEPWPGPYKYSTGDMKGKPVEPCGDGCPDLEAGRCKPSADLYFQLDKFPMLGAVCRLHTTSYQSIRQISSGLQQVIQTFGGLAGVRMMLKVRPEKVKYSGNDGNKKSSTAHILSLELDADDWKKLLANATEMKALFQSQRKMLGAHHVEIVEDEEERAPEITREFAPENIDRKALPSGVPKAEIPQSFEEVSLRSKIHRLCASLSFNKAKENMLLGQHQGRLEELAAKLEEFGGEDSEPPTQGASNGGTREDTQKIHSENPAVEANGEKVEATPPKAAKPSPTSAKTKAFDF
jgi:hypothetical protein